MHALRTLLRLTPLLALFLLGGAVRPDVRAEYQQKVAQLELECAQRQVDLGLWCRDRGFTKAAREHFLKAVEVSRGRHAHANNIKALMNRAGDGFWKKVVELTDKRRKSYDKKVKKLEKDDAEERFKLAKWASKKALEEEALAAFRAMIDPERPLVVGKSGRIETRAGEIPDGCSELLLADAIAINGAPYLRHGFLELLPGVEELYQASSDEILVRTTGSLEQAEDFQAFAAALVPELEAELGVILTRRPTLFLFPTRDEYERYLVEADRQSYRSVSGFADPYRFVTIVCTEDKSLAEAQGLALHELSHLADADAFPQAMPAWYREGFAEQFGGQGTFVWDGIELELRGEMDADRLEALRGAGQTWRVADFVRIEPLSLWGNDRDEAMRFYAQSWALYRWLSRDASTELRGRWDAWIDDCKLAVRTFPPGPQPVSSPDELFQARFGDVFDEIDRGLEAWLKTR